MRPIVPRLAIACAALGLFACRTKQGGIEIVAKDAPSNVHFVRVFLGTSNVGSTLDSSTTLTVPAPIAAPAQGSATMTTATQNIFVRDPGNANDTAAYDGHDVTFEFESNGDTGAVLAAIVVGYTTGSAGGVPVAAALLQDLTLNDHEIDVYDADLSSTATLPFLWSTVADATTPVTQAECAGFSSSAGSAFIIMDPDDEDCDGYIDGSDVECSPFVFHDPAGVSTNETCFYAVADDSQHGAECRLGGRVCEDGIGVGSNSACGATNTCVPNIACACAATDLDVSKNALGCLAETPAAADSGYDCAVGIPNGNCTIAIPPVTTGGMPCKTTGNHGGLAAAGSTKFTTTTVDSGGYAFTLTINAACGATLEIEPDSMGGSGSGGGGSGSGGSGGGAASAFPNLLVKLELVNGASLIYPIALTANPAAMCMGDQPPVCMRAPQNPFDESLTQCVAGWGTRTSTMLNGTSPTLDAGMDVMYYIDATTNAIMGAVPGGSGAWTSVTGPTLTLSLPAVAVHLTDDGNTLYVTDMGGFVNSFQKQGNMFVPIAAATPFMPGTTQATWYSPDAQQTDVIYADTEQLWELTSSGGPPFMIPVNPFEKGQTPYMSEDSTALWFAETTNGSGSENEIFVQQRVGSAAQFSDAVGSPELGTSITPQGPWVEPLPSTPSEQMMFFSSQDNGAVMPTIYSVQRAPLLEP
ncbi:MAG TPA: hypothetical protein VH143_07885 [Kofleriaceae bacterium]|jgi:hypothetical protein|nr:hypothetical protein [Kofleriaceae bacterium]